MSQILLLQADGKLPNMALMRISDHHRRLGDSVSLWQVRTAESARRGLWDSFDKVYASAIFERTRPVMAAIRESFPGVILGGTGWDISATLSQHGIDDDGEIDYTLYPTFTASMGFTQRGCRLSCEFCVVPRKEGKIRPSKTIPQIWRGEPFPRHVLLLDNDFFGNPLWKDRIDEILAGGFKVNFNQGINARMISEEAAEAIAKVDYRDADFSTRRTYTAWDSLPDEKVLFRGLERLVSAGVKPRHIMVYMLIGYWPGEDESDWVYRHSKLTEFGAVPYPMPYVRNTVTVGFQRWSVGGYWRRVSWADWKRASCNPRKLGGMTSLPLLPGLTEVAS